MRLPPEIRNRIYDLALGNKVIHIGTERCSKTDRGSYHEGDLYRSVNRPARHYVRLVHVVCQWPVDAEEIVHRRSKDSSQPTDRGYFTRHEECLGSLHEGKSRKLTRADQKRCDRHVLPGLTRVCRDIHREVALIPYMNNTFAFQDGKLLDLFVTKSLLSPQRAAINTLQVYGSITATRGYSRITCKVPKMLTGLHTLEIISISWPYTPIHGHRFPVFGRALQTVRMVFEERDGEGKGPESKAELRELAERAEEHLVWMAQRPQTSSKRVQSR